MRGDALSWDCDSPFVVSVARQNDIRIRRHNRDTIRLNRAPRYWPSAARPVIVIERYAIFVALRMPLRFLRCIDEAKDYPTTVAARLDA